MALNFCIHRSSSLFKNRTLFVFRILVDVQMHGINKTLRCFSLLANFLFKFQNETSIRCRFWPRSRVERAIWNSGTFRRLKVVSSSQIVSCSSLSIHDLCHLINKYAILSSWPQIHTSTPYKVIVKTFTTEQLRSIEIMSRYKLIKRNGIVWRKFIFYIVFPCWLV